MTEIVQQKSELPKSPKSSTPLLVITGVLLALFIYGAIVTLAKGHHAWGTTEEVLWGLLISAYVYFAVGCTGLCLLSTLGHRVWILRLVFGDTKFTNTKEFEDMGIKPIILAITFLSTAFLVLALELKYPLNLAIYAVLSPNFQSAFIWMGYLYGIYLVFLIAEVFFHMRNKEKIVKVFAVLAITTGLAATSNLGAVFGTMPGRAFWTSPYLPILFIFTALLTGAAALLILFYFTSERTREQLVPYLSKLLVLFIIVVLILTIWNILSGLIGQSPERYEATMYLLTGSLSISFWVFELGFGLLLPLLIVLTVKDPRSLMAAGVMVLVGMAFARHNLITAGQIVSLKPEVNAPVTLLSYTPTFVEYSMVIGALSMIFIGYFLGIKLVNKYHKAH
ncbi:hypothetical protein BKP37_13090 [Anaerobacillus alkalilacustris]|uniref:Polysulfide reductase n=1 Tax=Anaerobacillus alkalilacustris TaxID=393763 RepID=A0A1S2LIN0_9BACI|nr:NrfD/PsrC family molybdoenzyme membrane anchor subunit [Anaerobacillus alkalilacustris]OIJ12372.1 hypothetical protein BKP37_13090 [Anaerobacillus alkalilacustris]